MLIPVKVTLYMCSTLRFGFVFFSCWTDFLGGICCQINNNNHATAGLWIQTKLLIVLFNNHSYRKYMYKNEINRFSNVQNISVLKCFYHKIMKWSDIFEILYESKVYFTSCMIMLQHFQDPLKKLIYVSYLLVPCVLQQEQRLFSLFPYRKSVRFGISFCMAF